MISKTIKYIENKLQNYPFFFRIHQSSYINLKEMKQYYHGKGGYIVMSDGKSLTVARHRKKALLQKLEYYQ
jgi:two-component system LytT family response regulator